MCVCLYVFCACLCLCVSVCVCVMLVCLFHIVLINLLWQEFLIENDLKENAKTSRTKTVDARPNKGFLKIALFIRLAYLEKNEMK